MKSANRQPFEVQSHFDNLYNDALYRAERPNEAINVRCDLSPQLS